MTEDEELHVFLKEKFACSSTSEFLLLSRMYAALQAECEKLSKDVAELEEGIARCRQQASYCIGNEEALKNQLSRVRDIANEVLISRGAKPVYTPEEAGSVNRIEAFVK